MESLLASIRALLMSALASTSSLRCSIASLVASVSSSIAAFCLLQLVVKAATSARMGSMVYFMMFSLLHAIGCRMRIHIRRSWEAKP